MEELESQYKSNFCLTANALTQFYKNGLQLSTEAHNNGVKKTVDRMNQFLLSQKASNQSVVSIDLCLRFLDMLRQEVTSQEKGKAPIANHDLCSTSSSTSSSSSSSSTSGANSSKIDEDDDNLYEEDMSTDIISENSRNTVHANTTSTTNNTNTLVNNHNIASSNAIQPFSSQNSSHVHTPFQQQQTIPSQQQQQHPTNHSNNNSIPFSMFGNANAFQNPFTTSGSTSSINDNSNNSNNSNRNNNNNHPSTFVFGGDLNNMFSLQFNNENNNSSNSSNNNNNNNRGSRTHHNQRHSHQHHNHRFHPSTTSEHSHKRSFDMFMSDHFDGERSEPVYKRNKTAIHQ
jgi:hypothetical protein